MFLQLQQWKTSIQTYWNAIPWNANKVKIPIISLGIILFISINIGIYQFSKSTIQQSNNRAIQQLNNSATNQSTSITISPTPTPYPFENHGKIVFNISYIKKTGPRFFKSYIDPFDAKIGGKQIFGISIASDKPVQSVTTEWNTDHKKQKIPMKLVSGTNTNGTWEATWNVDDTIWYKLLLSTQATTDTETNTYEASLR